MIEMKIGSLRKLAYRLREDSEELTISPEEILNTLVKYCVEKEQELKKCYAEITDKDAIIAESFTKEDSWRFKTWYNMVDDDLPKHLLSQNDHNLATKVIKKCNI